MVSPDPAVASTTVGDGLCAQTVGNAGGVSVSRVGNDCVVIFISGSNTWTIPAGVGSVRLLLIGGGAGGAGDGGGGGGGGGGVAKTNVVVTPGAVANLSVGGGGLSDQSGTDTTLDLDGNGANEWTAPGGSAGAGWATRTGGAGGIPNAQNSAAIFNGGRGGDGPATILPGQNATNNSLGNGFQSDITGVNLYYGGGGGGGIGAHRDGAESGNFDGGVGGHGGGGRGAAQRSSGVAVTWTYTLNGSTSNFSSTLNPQCNANSGLPKSTMGFPGLNGTGGGGGGGVAFGDGCSDGSNTTDDGERTAGGTGGSGAVILRFSIPVPAAVQNFSGESRYVDPDSDSDSVTLNWSAVTGQLAPVTGYKIYYSPNSDFSNPQGPVNVSGGSTTSATITGLNDGATYYFQIYAVNDVGDSATEATTVSRAVSKEDYALDIGGSVLVSAENSTVIPPGSNEDFSVEFWFKATSSSNSILFSQGGDQDNRGNTYYVKQGAGDLVVHFNGNEVNTGYPIQTDAWTHFAHTIDADNTSTGSKVYINGALIHQSSGARQSFTLIGGDHGLHIGSNARTDGEGFPGQIDQVKVWSDVLTPTEVAASMHAWQADTNYDGTDDIDNLIAHYDFNDNTQAAVLRDMAGSKDLTVTNGATSDFKSLVNRPTRAGYEVFEFTRSYLTAKGGWQVPQGVASVDYLVVGGGGGGGNGNSNAHGGGGGGGGGFLEGTDSSASGVKKIVVGQGGFGGAPGANGGSSQYSTLSVLGGGGGGSYGGDPGDGASGGGAGHTATDSMRTGGSTLVEPPIYGSGGGSTTSTGWGQKYAAGGGGAGGSGGNSGTLADSGKGGAGKSSSIAGSAQVFGAGGGAGGGQTATSRSQVFEGGGAGGYRTDVEFAGGLDGLSGRGGGGGGGTGYYLNSQSGFGLGGNGGSGVVVLAYQIADAVATNPTNASALTTRTATFSTDASGSAGTPTYQWQVSSDGGVNFSDIAGATTSSYTTPALTSADNNKQYRVVVTASLNGSTDTVITDVATLTVSDIVSSSLILHYNASDINSFDPTVSTTAVKDLSGNNRDATIVTNSGNSVSRDGQSFKFDGSQSFIDAPDLPSTIDFSAGITIDFVADFETPNSWERIIDFGNGEQAENIIVARPGIEANNIRFEIYDAVNSSNQDIGYISFEFTNALLSGLNRYTVKASHSEVILYQNGSATGISGTLKVGSGFGVPKTILRTNNYVGESNWGADSIFDGSIRQVSVYNQPLSPSQVAVTYQTVTFDSNGGTDPASLITSGTIRLPSPGTKNGYTFGGWYTAEDYLTSAGDVGDTYTPGDTSLHAKWNSTLAISTPNSGLAATVDSSFTLDISSEVSGGPGGNSFALISGSLPTGLSLNTSTGVISGTPTVAGSSTIAVRVTDSSTATASTSSFTITVSQASLSTVQNLTATATAQTLKSIEVSWTAVSNADSYTLKVYDSTGTGSPLLTKTLDKALTSYTITDAVGSFENIADGTQYQISLTAVGSGNYVTSSESSKVSVTTTASYSVTYNTNGASGGTAPSNQVKVHGVDLTLQSNSGSLEKTGYTFSGWNTQADGQGTNFAEGATYSVDADLPLYAKWVQSTFTVTWDSNGGSSIANGSFTAGGTLSAPTAPTKTDKIFGGWSTSESSNQGEIANRVTFPYSPPQTSAITLYAIWLSVAPPQNVSATAANQSLLVQWTAPSTAATEVPTGYQVEWSTTGTTTGTWNVSSSSIAANATSHTITALTNGTSYYVRVVALYNGAKGAYGYPWTKIFETQTLNRVAGQIDYLDGFGLSDNAITLSRGDFSRVRYELRAAYSDGGAVNFVDANFDKTLSSQNSSGVITPETYANLYRLQVPVPSGGVNSVFEIHGNVTDVDVFSNVAGVEEGIGQGGRLEIWPWNYGVEIPSGLTGGDPSNTLYDYADSPTGDSQYGSFQLHIFKGSGAVTAFAWNRHYDTAARAIVGFGDNTAYGPHADWTFADTNGMPSRSAFEFRSYANLSVTPEPDTYTITFNYNGGDGGTRPVDADYTVGGTAITLPAPTISDGRLFGGWYSDSGLTTFVGYSGGTYTPSANGNLYARWTNLLINLDGSNGDSLANSGTTWTSVLPGASNAQGTKTGNAAYFGSDGSIEGFEFDNSGDAVVFPANTGNIAGQLTLEMWIQPSSLRNGWNLIASKWFDDRGNSSTGTFQWHLAIKKEGANPLRLNAYTSSNGTSYALTNAYGDFEFSNTDTKWYLVGFTIDSSNNLQFYVNGQKDGSPHAGAVHTPRASQLWIGDARANTGFAGKVSEFRLYNKALSATEMQSSFASKASTYGLATIELNKGDNGVGTSVTGYKYDDIGFALPDSATANSYFTRTGYTVTGWSTNSDGSTSDYPLGGSYTTNANEVLYPVWTANTYTITYKAGDGATGSDQTATKTHDVDLTLANKVAGEGWFTRANYEITGWSVNANGSTTDYALGATYSTEAALTLYPVWESTSIEATHDTWVQSGSSSNTVLGARTDLLFKNASISVNNSYNRVSYAKFEYDAAFNWSGAALEIVVTGNSDGSRNNGYNRTYTTFNVDVFGMHQSTWDEATLTFNLANSSTQDWGLNTGVWPWNPDNGTYLGTISIPTSSSTVGQKFALSNSDLDTFLNADSDGVVTFYMRRSDVDNQANLSFASSEHPTYPGPSLVVAGSGYEYTIAYDINGGTGTLPASGKFVEGSGNDYTIAATTGITPPANKVLSGWNTKKDGSGTDYAPGATYNSTSSLTLYAKFVDYPKVTFKSNYSGGPADIQQNVTPSTNTALRLNSFARTGHTFAGWDTQADGNGTDYADGANINLSADEELFAQWTANTYTVRYEYQGGTEPNNTTQATFTVGSGSPITLPTPTRSGYNFDGWYVGVYLTKVGNAGATYEPPSNITLNAKWNAVDYSLTYATTNGTGTAPTDSATYNIGQSAVIKANTALTRNGYNFAGWVLDLSDGSETPKNAGDTVTFSSSNITLYPKWTPATYTITYSANGATAGSLPKASDSFTTEGSDVDLPDAGTLGKTGHNFGGWSLSPSGAAVADSFSTSSDVTLYAVWTVKPITVTYGKGLASTVDPGVTVPGVVNSTFGSLATIGSPSSTSIDVLAPAGVDHEFFGWSDGTTTYQPGQSIRLGESNLSLTAEWLRVYQVRYALNGGTLAAGDFVHDTECGSAPDWICAPGQITANSAPSRSGYNFMGWKDQAGADIEAGSQFTVDNDSYILYAQWEIINYNFSFNTLGGSVPNSSTQKTIGELLTFPSPGSKTGYTFAGWTDGTLTYQAGSKLTVGTSSKGFQAVWTPNVYTVTYDWQGGKVKTGESVKLSDSYTVGSGNMSLPSGTTYERDGYNFAGWATSAGGSAVTNYQPTTNVTLYARWDDGNYTLTYNPKGGDAGGASGTVGRGSSVTLPTPTRAGFVFNGWFDAETGGNKIGNGGDSHNPGRSKTLYANWVQRSLFGVDLADLDTAANLSIGSGGTGGSFTKNSSNGTSASVAVPNGALPENTTVTARYFKDLQRQADLIEGDNNYIFSLLVSWITGSGDSATVPDTDPSKPITVTITSDAIKAGQSIYQVIGDQVTFLGKATVDGSASVDLYEDPEIVLVATAPSAPTGVTVTAGTNQATVSWTAPSDGGSPITGYTVTSNPGSLSCTTTGATSCVVPGLTDGTSYTFSVTATNSVGTSASSSSSSSISPLAPTYTVTYNSNGGSAVSSATFLAGATLSAPASPTRSGYTFDGWSTTLNDASTKVTFPYTAADLNLTFFALWTQNQSGGGTPSQPVVVPPVTPTPSPNPSPTPGPVAPPSQIGFEPTPPATPVSQTGPVGNVVGSSQQVQITADAPKENLVASGLGWQIKVRVEEPAGNTVRVQENLGLQSPMTGITAISASGLRPNTYVEVWAFSEETYIGTLQVGANGQLASELELPDTLLPGEHTLQIGTLNTAGQLITLSIPLTVKGKVTVGTFKGYIAIYTADIHGQRLSAKVAGKWVVQDPISRYKRFTYSRLVRFTGAGYDIIVDVYINRKFYERSTTRTR